MPAAGWTRDARDLTNELTNDPSQWKNWWTIEQVSDHTGLRIATLRDILARQPIQSESVPRGALCRPAGRLGLLSAVPLWAPEQIAEYDRRLAAQREAAKDDTPRTDARLPEVTPGQAARRGLVSIGDLATQLECAPNTLRRFTRDYADSFPPKVAVAKRDPSSPHGRQHQLRSRIAVLRWLVENPHHAGREVAEKARELLSDEAAEVDSTSDAVA